MTENIKILFAEDDPEDRLILNDCFAEIGADAHIAFVENGEKLIAYLDNIPKNQDLPALVVLDLNMPRLNGTETLRLIKRHDRYKNIPVVIFSTSMNEIEMKKCRDLGAMKYIIKPSRYEESVRIARLFYDYSMQAIPALD